MFTRNFIVSTILFLSLSITINAQQQSVYELFGIEQAPKRWEIGIKAGLNLSTVHNYQSFRETTNSVRPGFHIGVTGEYELFNRVYFEPSLLFTLKGSNAKCKYEFIEIYDPNEHLEESTELDTMIVKGTAKDEINLYYLEIPLHLAYRFTFSKNCHLDIQAGPYFAVGLFGKTRTYDSRFSSTALFVYDSFDRKSMFIRTDIGLSTGITVGFFDHYRLGVNYQHGFTGLKEDTERNEKNPRNRNWMISAAYMF